RGPQPSFFDRVKSPLSVPTPRRPACGDRVFFQGLLGDYDGATFQQYCRVPADLLAHMPPNISDGQAAGISLATVATAVALYDERMGHGLPPLWVNSAAGAGPAIVVLGGAASVGQYAVQLARLSGFTCIVANAVAANCELVKSLGAHVVLDRSIAATADDYVRALDGLPIDVVLDAIGHDGTQTLPVAILQAAAARPAGLATSVAAPAASCEPCPENEGQRTCG
ncbi:hypothetical protein HK405_000779, partial [Cladochytrium tenue]